MGERLLLVRERKAVATAEPVALRLGVALAVEPDLREVSVADGEHVGPWHSADEALAFET